MSIGLMMTGIKSTTGKPITARVKDDFYPTHDDLITRALVAAEIDRILPFRVVHEPCCGKGDIARVLENFGLRVRASDLVDRGYGQSGVDFRNLKRLGRCVITNPPFDADLPEALIRQALTSGTRYLALLLKEKYFYVQKRVELFREHTPVREYKICWRPDFLGLGGGTMDVSWWVWQTDVPRLHTQPVVHLLTKNGGVV